MADFQWYKDIIVVIDNASGTTARITSYVNQHSIAGALRLLSKNAAGTTADSFQAGMVGATVSLNYFVNSTTKAIFGPLVGQRTSVTKTFGVKDGLAKWYKGEVWPTNVQESGSAENLMVGSCDLTFEGSVSHTSTGPS